MYPSHAVPQGFASLRFLLTRCPCRLQELSRELTHPPLIALLRRFALSAAGSIAKFSLFGLLCHVAAAAAAASTSLLRISDRKEARPKIQFLSRHRDGIRHGNRSVQFSSIQLCGEAGRQEASEEGELGDGGSDLHLVLIKIN